MVTRRYRILGGLLAILVVATAALGVVLSYDSPCVAPAPPTDGERMRALLQTCYGSPEVLAIVDIAKPAPRDNEVLVRVRAASINPADLHRLSGTPYLFVRPSVGVGAPTTHRYGTDYSGTVEAVGKDVTRFAVGDEVFGGRTGALAEYLTADEDRAIVRKPANISFEQAAAIPVAALTALQGLRDFGKIEPGQKVLINGASGGVGTFAVQLAKAFGAEVTAVCSTRNVELVRSLGADHVIDYTQQNFTEGRERYDLILDNVGNHSVFATRRALVPGGKLVLVSGPKNDPWLGPIWRVAEAKLAAPFVEPEMTFFIATLNPGDLEQLAELVRAGKVTPAVDRQYPFAETAAAVAYLAEGHARAKVVVTLDAADRAQLSRLGGH